MRLSRRLLLAGGAGLAAGRTDAAQLVQQPPPPSPGLVIGALLPLSGDFSLVGDECLRGIELAAAAINATGGIAGAPVNLVPGDSVGQNQVEAAAQTLLNAGHAGLLLGSGDSALSYPGSAAAELAQTPYIELNAPADGITNRGFKFLLRTGPTTTMIAATAITAIGQRFKGRKVGLLFNTGATAGAIAAAALAAWAAANTPPLLAVAYPEGSVDLADPVSRLKRAGAQVILHAAGAADVLFTYLAMHNLGWKPDVVGCGDGFLLRETAYALGPALDNTLVVGAPFYPPRAAYIATAYMDRYGMPPRAADSLTAYVGAKLVFDKLNAAGGDPSHLLDALHKTDIPNGTLANGWGAAFDKNGQNTRSFATVQQWKDGTLAPLV